MDATMPYIHVIDDVVDGADSQVMLLQMWGFEAQAFYCGADALDAARCRRPDAVLLDLGMPKMNGFQFTLRLHELPGCGNVPIIAVTGHELLQLRAREVGIDHYLIKPVEPNFLKALLKRLFACNEPSRPMARSPRHAESSVSRTDIGGDATPANHEIRSINPQPRNVHMYRTGILVAALFTSLMLLGCGSKSSSSADDKISNAGDKISEAEKATIEAAKAKRDEYAKDMQKKLDELDAKYKALEKRAAEAKGDSKKELDEKVKTAKAKRDDLAKKLDELKEASHDRWEKIKDGVGSAYEDLKKVIE